MEQIILMNKLINSVMVNACVGTNVLDERAMFGNSTYRNVTKVHMIPCVSRRVIVPKAELFLRDASNHAISQTIYRNIYVYVR